MNLEKLKAVIEDAEAQIKKHTDNVDVLSKNIDILAQDRSNAQSFIHSLNGALYAYKDVEKALKESTPEELIEEGAAVLDSFTSES